MMTNKIKQTCLICSFVILSASFLLAGCQELPSAPQPVPPSSLSPYQTRTPVIIPSATILHTQIPVPTPTPVVYTIARNDTLSSIAGRFGVSVEALLAANPGTAPQALSVGQTIVIPAASGETPSVLLSTPVPVDLGPDYCQATSGGTACLIAVHNPYPQAVENVKVQVTLFDENGLSLASQDAILPLNILPAGQVLPAAVFFNDLNEHTSVQSQVVTSIRLAAWDNRYIKTDIQNLLVSIDWNRLSANVQGTIRLQEAEKPAASIWLAAVAYGAGGRITGYRRWEWSGTLQPGASLPFSLPVYSLGLSIERVEIIVEARP